MSHSARTGKAARVEFELEVGPLQRAQGQVDTCSGNVVVADGAHVVCEVRAPVFACLAWPASTTCTLGFTHCLAHCVSWQPGALGFWPFLPGPFCLPVCRAGCAVLFVQVLRRCLCRCCVGVACGGVGCVGVASGPQGQ